MMDNETRYMIEEAETALRNMAMLFEDGMMRIVGRSVSADEGERYAARYREIAQKLHAKLNACGQR